MKNNKPQFDEIWTTRDPAGKTKRLRQVVILGEARRLGPHKLVLVAPISYETGYVSGTDLHVWKKGEDATYDDFMVQAWNTITVTMECLHEKVDILSPEHREFVKSFLRERKFPEDAPTGPALDSISEKSVQLYIDFRKREYQDTFYLRTPAFQAFYEEEEKWNLLG